MATATTLPKKVLKLYIPPLIKNLGEADGTVRESSSEAIGTLLKCLGDKIILPLICDIEQLKQDKIKEYSEKCVLLNLKGEPRGGAAAAPKPVAKPAAAAPAKPAILSKAPAAGAKKPAGAKPAAKGDAKKIVNGGDDKKQAPEEPDMHVSDK